MKSFGNEVFSQPKLFITNFCQITPYSHSIAYFDTKVKVRKLENTV